MTKAVLSCWHKYTPFGGEFYEPILTFYLSQMKRWENEYDRLYLLDSTWNIDQRLISDKITIVKVDPSLRYYDAYKSVLPDIQETAILLMDNDMVVYKPKIIEDTFEFLREGYSVVSIYDTIGKTFEEMGGKSKVCPYWFCTRKELLMRYRDINWSPDLMPDYETFGKLTEALIKDRVSMYEWPETKQSIYITGEKDDDKCDDTGIYHVRSGSVSAYLLATKHYGNKETYREYINNQPSREYIRQSAWFKYMGGDPIEIIEDAGFTKEQWELYYNNFIRYHHLR